MEEEPIYWASQMGALLLSFIHSSAIIILDIYIQGVFTFINSFNHGSCPLKWEVQVVSSLCRLCNWRLREVSLGDGVEGGSPGSFLFVCAAPLASVLGAPYSPLHRQNWVLGCVDMTFVCLGAENMQNKRSEQVQFGSALKCITRLSEGLYHVTGKRLFKPH